MPSTSDMAGHMMIPQAPGDSIEVEISDTQAHLRVDRDALVSLVRGVLNLEGRTRGSISLALVDDATIRGINRAHLEHDWPTDVISFPLSAPDDPELTGELVVSAEMAATTARQIGVDPWHELALYVVHGLLHLCGYDDSDEASSSVMRDREGVVLAAEGLWNPYPLVGESLASRLGGGTASRVGVPAIGMPRAVTEESPEC